MSAAAISQAVPLRLLKSTMAGSLAALWAGHVGILLLGLLIIWLAYRELYRRARILHESQAELLQLHQEVKLSQSKLLQSEKMASVGQLAAGGCPRNQQSNRFISPRTSRR